MRARWTWRPTPAGMAGAIAADGAKSGVFIGETQTTSDDKFTFAQPDGGIHVFRVSAHTAGTSKC